MLLNLAFEYLLWTYVRCWWCLFVIHFIFFPLNIKDTLEKSTVFPEKVWLFVCLIGVKRHFIAAVSFTGRGSRSIRIEPLTLRSWQTLSRAIRVNATVFYDTKSGANSGRIGDRLQWSVQVSLNQLPRHSTIQAPYPEKGLNNNINIKTR